MRKRFLALLLALAALPGVFSARADAPKEYVRAGATQNCFLYGDSGYQVEYRYDIEDKFRDQLKTYIDNYNQLLSGDDIDLYLYFVNNSRSLDFTQLPEKSEEMFEWLCGRLTCVDHAACLKIDSFETYKRLFYQTDHHWNHVGAQQGYEDMVRLLLGDGETPNEPVEEVAFDAVFNGSYSLRTGIHNAQEPFAVYRYDFPQVTPTVEGKKKAVGRQAQYFAGKYSRDPLAPHFATYFGGDWGELVYDTGRPEKENLLVLCNSYGCSVRGLIYAHFNKTYVVDMREYMNQTGRGMFIRQYLKDHEIDKVLILGDISYFLYGKLLH